MVVKGSSSSLVGLWLWHYSLLWNIGQFQRVLPMLFWFFLSIFLIVCYEIIQESGLLDWVHKGGYNKFDTICFQESSEGLFSFFLSLLWCCQLVLLFTYLIGPLVRHASGQLFRYFWVFDSNCFWNVFVTFQMLHLFGPFCPFFTQSNF